MFQPFRQKNKEQALRPERRADATCADGNGYAAQEASQREQQKAGTPHLVQVGEEQGPLPSPVQQALLAAPAKQLAAMAVKLGTIQARNGPLQVLAGAVMDLSSNVVLLQPGLAKDQHRPPAHSQIPGDAADDVYLARTQVWHRV